MSEIFRQFPEQWVSEPWLDPTVAGDVARAAFFGAVPSGSATGEASGTVALTGSATGAASAVGTASGALDMDGTSVGAARVSGGASGALELGGTATGTVRVSGAASGTLDLGGSATGKVEAAEPVVPLIDLAGVWRATVRRGVWRQTVRAGVWRIATVPARWAAIVALAGLSGSVIAGTVVVAAPLTGVIAVSFPAAALGVGGWVVEVAVTLGAETQTVATMTVNVVQSLSAP